MRRIPSFHTVIKHLLNFSSGLVLILGDAEDTMVTMPELGLALSGLTQHTKHEVMPSTCKAANALRAQIFLQTARV